MVCLSPDNRITTLVIVIADDFLVFLGLFVGEGTPVRLTPYVESVDDWS